MFFASNLSSSYRSHVDSFFVIEEQKRLDRDVFDTLRIQFSFVLDVTDTCRLLGTKWQRTRSCFHDSQISLFNKQDQKS